MRFCLDVWATAGWLVVAMSAGGALAEPAACRLQVNPTTVTVVRGGRAVMVYQRTAHPFKPYVKQLQTPAGVQPLLDSPADHIHHHALMFAVSVDGKTFWSEYPHSQPGRQKPRPDEDRFTVLADGRARLEQTLDWVDCDGVKRLVEKRAVTLEGPVDQATLLTWRSSLQAPPGRSAVQLGGAHYEGLGMRFVRVFDGRAVFIHQAGQPGPVFRGDERLTPGRWCAVCGTVNGKPVTAAMFDDPANPRTPAVWFTMARPFAYLAATLALHKTPIALKAGQTLTVRYGVAVWDGHVTAATIEKMYRQWLWRTAPASPHQAEVSPRTIFRK